MIQRYKHHIYLHFIVFLFGFTGILGKLISIGAIPLVMYRVLIASVAIGLFLLVRKERLRISANGWWKAFVTGLITAAHWICFFESIKQSNVSVALICLSSTTFFTSFLEPIFHKRKIKGYETLLGLIVIIGIGFIFNIETRYAAGILFGVLSAFLAAVFSVINSVLVRSYDAKLLSFWELFSGFIGVLVYLLLANPEQLVIPSSADLIYLFILGIICTAFAFVVSIEIMKYLTPYTVNISINLEPIYGIILALMVFGASEKMSAGFYVGASVIILVILANAWLKRQRSVA